MKYHTTYGWCRPIADRGLFVLVCFVSKDGLLRTVSVGGLEVRELSVGKCALKREG